MSTVKNILITQLGLPVAATATAVGAEAVGSALASGAQQVVDFTLPSKNKKVAEATNKAAGVGNLPEFSKVTNGVGVSDNGQSVDLIDETTGAPVAKVMPSAQDQTSGTSLYSGAQAASKTDGLKVKLVNKLAVNEVVTFTVMPTISEQHGAEYLEFSPVHHPGQIIKYKRTQARGWTINAKLISRTSAEAEDNIQALNIIRSWVMPNYGSRAATSMGSPPPVLTLTAYGERMIGPIKCVLENYSWTFPDGVDYVPTKANEPFPVILEISLTLKESWSPAEFSNFSLIDYREGRVSGTSTSAFYYVPQVKQSRTTTAVQGAQAVSGNFVSGANAARRVDQQIAAEVKKQAPQLDNLPMQLRANSGQDVGQINSVVDPGMMPPSA